MSEVFLGILIATLVVGLTGIIIAVLLGIASEKFKVEVDEKEVAVREITVVDVVIRAVMDWRQQSQRARLRYPAARLAEKPLQR